MGMMCNAKTMLFHVKQYKEKKKESIFSMNLKTKKESGKIKRKMKVRKSLNIGIVRRKQ